MILDDNSLYKQLSKLAMSGGKEVNWRVQMEFLIGETVMEVPVVESLVRMEHYVSSHTGLYHAKIRVFQTQHIQKILPHRDNLVIRLIFTLTDTEGTIIPGKRQETQLFRAFLTDTVDPTIISSSATSSGGGNIDDLGDMRDLMIELRDMQYYHVRSMETFGTFRSCSMKDLLQGLLTVKTPKTDEGNVSINVDVSDDPHNNRIYYQVAIEAGIELERLPDYLHEKYGIYNTGLGSYFKKGFWYIYPLSDIYRYYRSLKKLTILAIPPKEMGLLTNTYNDSNPNDIIIFSTSGLTYSDESERTLNNLGNGFRYATGRTYPDNIRKVSGGVVTIPKGHNSRTVVVEERPSRVNRLKMSDEVIHVNPFKAASDVMAGLTAVIQLRWDYSNPDILYPGMPVKILYKSEDKIKSILGTLAVANSSTQAASLRPGETRFVTTTELTFVVTRTNVTQ